MERIEQYSGDADALCSTTNLIPLCPPPAYSPPPPVPTIAKPEPLRRLPPAYISSDEADEVTFACTGEVDHGISHECWDRRSPDPSCHDFRSLTACNAGFGNIIITLPESKETLFWVRNSKSVPTVTMRFGSKVGQILGVLRLGFFKWSVITAELGDAKSNPVPLHWTKLDKVSSWTHNRHEFSFSDGRHRKIYKWETTKRPFFGDQPDLVLRQKAGPGEPRGEVLAVYKGHQRPFRSKRGTFHIRKGVWGNGLDDDLLNNWDNWELMVLLTGLGLIEACRQRTRRRRHRIPGF